MALIYKYQTGNKLTDLDTSKIENNINSDYNKLTEAQKEILKKGNNLETIKEWYNKSPENMHGFIQWINTYNSNDLLQKYKEKENKFQEALKNSREWNNEWYKQRAKLPQFKNIATKKLNISNQLNTELSDPINLSMDWWKGKIPDVFYAPEIGGITRNNKAKININDIRTGDVSQEIKAPESFFENQYWVDTKGRLQNSLITHEENHERDNFAPQDGTKHNVNKFKWGEENNLDPIEKIITKEEQLNDSRNEGYSNSYQQQPTEIRSRLQNWRQINNINPLKKYSVEEIDKIIKSNLNNPKLNTDIKDLLETLKNDPVKLKYLNDSYVLTKNNNESKIAKAKKGGLIYKYQTGNKIPFNQWYKTVPLNKNDTSSYNLRKAYELASKEDLNAFVNDSEAHLLSAYKNPKTGIYEFMKSKNHPTVQKELEWFNSNDPEAIQFRKDYYLDDSKDYYQYIPKHKKVSAISYLNK
jgi:hypothetical protein